ncbi:S-adenosyl-L-methionine-dependent methyltransferase [Butyriboletus roseoflavus]|nr:S-adenosyl-L-methionine-dependent methyltransferase [Butyriboletus roseoflavus]
MSLITTQSPAERKAHSYAGSLYLLPSDEEERQRLLAQHQLYTRILSGRLIIPPISVSEKDEVLDIGTGAGAWLCDTRTHLPEAVQLYGVDIEPRLFPNYTALSANVHLSVCSATDLPSYWTSKFALVHQRLLICAYTRDQWRRSIDEMFRVLVPGGYAQLIEIGPEWVSGSKTAAHVLFLDDFLGSKGMLLRCGVYIVDMLKAAGFVDVKYEEVVMNLGKWAGEDGVQGRDATIGAWRGMRDSVMKAGRLDRLDRFASAEGFDKAMDEIAEEWDNVGGSRTAVRAFYGRKPF